MSKKWYPDNHTPHVRFDGLRGARKRARTEVRAAVRQWNVQQDRQRKAWAGSVSTKKGMSKLKFKVRYGLRGDN